MSLPGLLLCGLVAVAQCMNTSNVELGGSVIFVVSCSSHRDVYSTTEMTKCPWMASSQSAVFVPHELPSFEKCMEDWIAVLESNFKECKRGRFPKFAEELRNNPDFPIPSATLLKEVIHKADPQITGIRDILWRLLFRRVNDANAYPLTLDEMNDICDRCQNAIETIKSSCPSIPGPIVQWAFEACVSNFVLPAIESWWCGARPKDHWRKYGNRLSRYYIGRYIDEMRLMELAVSASQSSRLFFETRHPGLIVFQELELETEKQKELFAELMLSKDLPLDVDAEYEKAAGKVESGIHQKCYEEYNVNYRLKFFLVIDKDGVKKWRLIGSTTAPVAMDENGKWRLSYKQAWVDLQHAISKVTDGKTVRYCPKPKVSAPEMSLIPEVLIKVFLLCLEMDPNTKIDGVCKWTQYIFPSLTCYSEGFSPSSFQKIAIPSDSLVQFVLASLITIATRPIVHGDNKIAVEKLGVCVAVCFPMLLKGLVSALREFIGSQKLSDDSSEHSGDLLSPGFLEMALSRINPKDCKGHD